MGYNQGKDALFVLRWERIPITLRPIYGKKCLEFLCSLMKKPCPIMLFIMISILEVT